LGNPSLSPGWKEGKVERGNIKELNAIGLEKQSKKEEV
jgi:hypothetical protein